MKPLQGRTETVQRIRTSVRAHNTKNILPGRVSASGTPRNEGFRASMTVSRRRTALHMVRKPSCMPDSGGEAPMPPRLST